MKIRGALCLTKERGGYGCVTNGRLPDIAVLTNSRSPNFSNRPVTHNQP
jgi:hypothetical protein